MTPQQESTQQEVVSQTEFHKLLRQKLREAVRYTLIEVLEAEVGYAWRIQKANVGAVAQRRSSWYRRFQRDRATLDRLCLPDSLLNVIALIGQ